MEGYLNNTTSISLFPDMGRGVISNFTFTAADVDVPITRCELLVLSEEDTKKVEDTELKHYTFKFTDTQDCLVMGIGEMFNHSDTPNIGYRLINLSQGGETRKVMEFYLLKPVKRGEQMFIDYNADTKVNASEYTASKSMIG